MNWINKFQVALTMFLHQHIIVCIKTLHRKKPAHQPVNYTLSIRGLYFTDVLASQQRLKTLHNFTASSVIQQTQDKVVKLYTDH